MPFHVDNLSFQYAGDSEAVFSHLNFSVKPTEIFGILGPSGCGKTTLLRVLSGMLKANTGLIGDGFGAQKSFVFQEPRLLPWETVWENLAFSCRHQIGEEQFKDMADAYLEAVGLSGYKHHFPDELSGGMQQRIALVRAFLFPAGLMFLDEPFKSLDVSTRLSVLETFKALHKDHPKTMLLVTHDPAEAALLADRVLILSERPAQVKQILDNPVPREQRQMSNPALGAFQSDIYKGLLE